MIAVAEDREANFSSNSIHSTYFFLQSTIFKCNSTTKYFSLRILVGYMGIKKKRYNRLVKDFFERINPSNPLHYYGHRHIVIEKSKSPLKIRE